MILEGRQHSWITGFYWTLTVMSTLGFGDITFTSDAGRAFTIVVLLSGMVFLLILLPFTFIEFFYAPWMKAQAETRAPRQLPESASGHVILTNFDPVSNALMHKLTHYGYPYALLYRVVEANPARILDRTTYIEGTAADRDTLDRAGFDQAPAVVITTHDDDMNIYLTIYCRRLRPDIQIISRATRERNVSTLHRAGADSVLSYVSMGATTIFNYLRRAGVVAEGLHLAETRVPDALAGMTLAEAAIPSQTECNVVALRSETGMTINPGPSTILKSGAEIILIGTPESEQRFMELYGARTLRAEPIAPPGQAV